MSIQSLQSQIGVAVDGLFGKQTLAAAQKHFGLTRSQAAHFFGQCHHETGGFKNFTENLNYSADGLLRIWPQRFSPMSVARAYARDPEAIANRAYADRMGNGSAASGDGWKYRGRGAIQLTGRAAYQAFSKSNVKYAGVMDSPDLLATEFSFDAAVWYFDHTRLWIPAKSMNDEAIEKITRAINGGTHGLADRATQTRKYYAWLT